MGSITFQHDQLGSLQIDNGIDDAAWSYNLNTQSFPTYGGEVVQILSIYIDDLTLQGTCSTYRQIEAIYSYFAGYIQIATQGKTATGNIGTSTTGVAYNLSPVVFSYPERQWSFQIYPKSVPGFHYGQQVVAPTWQLTAFVIDDSPDLNLIKDGLKALAAKQLVDGNQFSLLGEISPTSGNPDTDPFETYTSGISQQQSVIAKYADYFNSLIPAYMKGDFSALIAGIGSKPSFGSTVPANNSGSTVTVPNTATTGSGGGTVNTNMSWQQIQGTPTG